MSLLFKQNDNINFDKFNKGLLDLLIYFKENPDNLLKSQFFTFYKQYYNINNISEFLDKLETYIKKALNNIIIEYEKIEKETVDIDGFLNIVEEYLNQEKIKSTSVAITEELKKPVPDYHKLHNLIQNLNDLHRFIIEEKKGYFDLNKIDSGDLVFSSDFFSSKVRIPTGFDVIDKLFSGGVTRSSLTTIIAPTGTGKTTTLANVAAQAFKSGRTVAFFTLEEEYNDILLYISQIITSETEGTVSENPGVTLQKLKEIQNVYGNNIIIHEAVNKGKGKTYFSIEDISSYIEEYNNTHDKKIDFIIVDYIGALAEMSGGSNNIYSSVGEIARGLKRLARYYRTPVITAHQTNKSVWKTGETDLSSVADSSIIIMRSDFVLLLSQSPEDYADRIMRFKSGKVRHGKKNIECISNINYSTKTIEFREFIHSEDVVVNTYTIDNSISAINIKEEEKDIKNIQIKTQVEKSKKRGRPKKEKNTASDSKIVPDTNPEAIDLFSEAQLDPGVTTIIKEFKKEDIKKDNNINIDINMLDEDESTIEIQEITNVFDEF
jgi:KaiC/GvpD/RAD55 family RecA-like ATPase